MTIQCVLFDLDGTFADTAPDLHYALDQVLLSRGLPPLPFEQLRPSVSHGSQAMLKVGLAWNPGIRTMPTCGKPSWTSIWPTSPARPGCSTAWRPCWRRSTQRGVRWGIVTNKPAWLTDPLMQALGLTQRAVCIVSGDTTAYAKPHPEPILHACRVAAGRA